MFEQNYYNNHGGGHHQNHHQQQQQIGYPMQNLSNANQRIHRSVSNQNVNSDRSECHVEYEVSMPVPILRHSPPYHSLWNIHQW